MSRQLEVCKDAAIAGGKAAILLKSGEMGVIAKKDDYVGGTHGTVTKADYVSQKAILDVILRRDSEASFITEEHVDDPRFASRVIRVDTLHLLGGAGGTYIIDELDGTSGYARGLYEWSISVGFVDAGLNHSAGAIYAPMINEGILFYGSVDGGSFVMENVRGLFEITRQIEVSTTKEMGSAYVMFGVDTPLKVNPVHMKFLGELSDMARTTNFNGSCALGLGLVGAGSVDVFIQPLQSPWDWAAGKAIVESAGGLFMPYRMEDGRVVPVERLEPRHYNPEGREVGFVAGSPAIAEQAFDMLLKLSIR